MTQVQGLDYVNDIDAHEMVPMHLWAAEFGEAAERIGELVRPFAKLQVDMSLDRPGLEDMLEINDANVWRVKGPKAPGAFDFSRRLDVMDAMGIERQLIFPSFTVFCLQLMLEDSFLLNGMGKDAMPPSELDSLCRKGIDEYNDWAVRTTAIDSNRLRPVGFIAPAAGSVEAMVEQAQDLISRGIRAVHIDSGRPPAGKSPAAFAMDPFWSLLAENDVACVTHVGGDGDFKRSNAWVKAEAFKVGKTFSQELGLEPYSFSVLHLPVSNFLVCMTLGGVFERHPNLRFGIIECGAQWFGPLAESMDMWESEMYHNRLTKFISMKPSEYLKRNVRVTPFHDVEPIHKFLAQYPHLADCYCYSSDYPHVEGGTDSKANFYEKVEPLGEDTVRKFFVTNAELLLPNN